MITKILLAVTILLSASVVMAQSADSTAAWQHHYKTEFLSDPHSPLKAADTADLRFFPHQSEMVFHARVKRLHRRDTITMATHSGKVKKYRDYAILTFSERSSFAHYPMMRSEHKHRLHVYQSFDLAKDTAYADYLFLPFTDDTNGRSTYGGGRYIDLKLSDIKGGHVILDFNKAYNPYCAYKGGYNCPIPTKENSLSFTEITAGEMTYSKAPQE